MLQIDMEMPKECHECPFQKKYKDDTVDDWYIRRCTIEGRMIEYPKPSWCPLKEAQAQLFIDEKGNVTPIRLPEDKIHCTFHCVKCGQSWEGEEMYTRCPVCGDAKLPDTITQLLKSN